MESGPVHLGKAASGASWNSPELDAGDKLEKIVAHLLVIRLEVLLNADNEGGCNCGEQTGLYPQENYVNTAANVCATRILTKIKVVQVFVILLRRDRIRWLQAGTCRRIRRRCCWKFRGGSKRDSNALSIASSKLENKNAISQSLETVGLLDTRLRADGCSPMVCYEEPWRGLKKGSHSMAYGK